MSNEFEINEEMKVMDDEQVCDMESLESSGNGVNGGLVVLGLGALAAAGFAVYKKLKPEDENVKAEKKRLKDEKAAEKLRKKGYVVYKADEVEVREVDVDDSDIIEETEE